MKELHDLRTFIEEQLLVPPLSPWQQSAADAVPLADVRKLVQALNELEQHEENAAGFRDLSSARVTNSASAASAAPSISRRAADDPLVPCARSVRVARRRLERLVSTNHAGLRVRFDNFNQLVQVR